MDSRVGSFPAHVTPDVLDPGITVTRYSKLELRHSLRQNRSSSENEPNSGACTTRDHGYSFRWLICSLATRAWASTRHGHHNFPRLRQCLPIPVLKLKQSDESSRRTPYQLGHLTRSSIIETLNGGYLGDCYDHSLFEGDTLPKWPFLRINA